ncbi:MAG: AAA family ATPase [Anaerolineae bacterium]|nr:AAA family ATPase [Anaerolineae bacterium]
MTRIILIGPPGTGKSTLGKLLSQRLGMPQFSLDTLRWDYYAEIGYDEALARQIRETEGFPALVAYWAQFDAHAVERILADHPDDCVIDFGAGHSIYDDEADFQRVQQALSGCHVVLILPSPDLDESARILTERQMQSAPPSDLDIIGGIVEQYVKHPSNHALATTVIYTKDQTPEAACDALVARLNL